MSADKQNQHICGDVRGCSHTNPRRPIAAMYSSPGPCYGLPGLVGQVNHDGRSVHLKMPAYPFGIKHGKFKDDCSPGPRYLPDSKILRDGRDGTPHYSLYGRNAGLSLFAVPGPGAYSPEDCGPTAKKMYPKYSFGIRHCSRRTDQTPGANRYSLPGMLGQTVQSGKRQAPCFSLRGQSKSGGFSEDLAKTPGPKYDIADANINKNRAPSYSLRSRNAMPGDSTKKPGPGAHSPENVYMIRRQAPQFSFGVRHSEYTAPLIVENVELNEMQCTK